MSGAPITRITAHGVATEAGEYEADVIVFATGFDAVTGSVTQIDVRGDDASLTERWKQGPRTNLGISVDGFPNFFMVSGPQTPFANIPVVIEGAVDWISKAITHMREGGYGTIEPTAEAVDGWRGHVNDLVNATVLRNGRNSWLLGDNIPGKPHEVLFFFGGAGLYRKECREVIEQGFTGFTFGQAAEPALT